ncbi:hypothetical protein ACFWER_29935, partial [Streptomyces sp. NPDC060188]
DETLDGARKLMEAALRACAAAVEGPAQAAGSPGAAPGGGADAGEARRGMVTELGHTHRQFGDLVARSVPDDEEEAFARAAFEESLGHLTRAIAVFASLGDDVLDARTGAELAAGRLEADLGRHEAAAARARAVLDACPRLDGDVAEARRAEAGRMLERVERPEKA